MKKTISDMILKKPMKRDSSNPVRKPKQDSISKNQPLTETFDPPYNQTKDGRLLGPSCEDFIPEGYRNKFPDPFKNPAHAHQEAKAINQIARQYMPLKLQQDGNVDFNGYKFRLRGINQNKFNALIAGLTSGMSRSGAAQLAGVGAQTLVVWERKAKEGREPYTLIVEVMREAEAHLEKILMEKLVRAGLESIEYTERVIEKERNRHGKLITVKKKEHTKTKLPQLGALIWRLERMRKDYQPPSFQPREPEAHQADDDLLLAMDVASTGMSPEDIDDQMGRRKQAETEIDDDYDAMLDDEESHKRTMRQAATKAKKKKKRRQG